VTGRRYELLGVGLAVEGDAGAPIEAALSPLAVDAAAIASAPPPAVVFAARRAPGPLADPASGTAVFVHPPVRGTRDGDTLVVGDASAAFAIRPGGARVDVEATLAPEALVPGATRDLVQALHVPIALAFALRHHRIFHLHAAALGDGDRAVLLAGDAIAGKTTLAVALLEAGLAAVCDDAAYLAEVGGTLRVQGVARPFHLRPATLLAFPRVAALAGPPDGEGRRDLDPAAAWSAPRREPLAPGLLLFPQITRRAVTAVERIPPADVLGGLVEASALVVVDGAARAPEHLALLGRLSSEAPAYRVALGEDLLREPVRVARDVLAAAR
jgi:hypothetical protein